MNGFAGDCPLGGFHLESPLYNGTISQQTFVLKNVPSDQLADFPATFEDLCHKGERYPVQATFTNLTEGSSLLLYIDSVGLKQASGRFSVNSSNVVLYASNVLNKPLEGGALLFTLFNLSHYQSAVNQSADGEVFTSSDHSGELVAHVLRTSSGPAQQANVTLGFLDKFEVEIKGHDIVMGAGEKRAALKLEQGATYVQLISGDLEGVSTQQNCEKLSNTFSPSNSGSPIHGDEDRRGESAVGLHSTGSVPGDHLRRDYVLRHRAGVLLHAGAAVDEVGAAGCLASHRRLWQSHCRRHCRPQDLSAAVVSVD